MTNATPEPQPPVLALSIERGAHFVDNGYAYNSYFVLPGGWKGQIHTGGWSLDNERRHIAIGGHATYVLP